MHLVVLPACPRRPPLQSSTCLSHAGPCPGSNIPAGVSSPRISVSLASLPRQAAIYLRWYLRWLHNSQAFRLATAAVAMLHESQFPRVVQRGPTTLERLWPGYGRAILLNQFLALHIDLKWAKKQTTSARAVSQLIGRQAQLSTKTGGLHDHANDSGGDE
jgi:hypothetical protein